MSTCTITHTQKHTETRSRKDLHFSLCQAKRAAATPGCLSGATTRGGCPAARRLCRLTRRAWGRLRHPLGLRRPLCRGCPAVGCAAVEAGAGADLFAGSALRGLRAAELVLPARRCNRTNPWGARLRMGEVRLAGCVKRVLVGSPRLRVDETSRGLGFGGGPPVSMGYKCGGGCCGFRPGHARVSCMWEVLMRACRHHPTHSHRFARHSRAGIPRSCGASRLTSYPSSSSTP